MTAPAVTIDFARQFSLPFGVPPTMAAAELATFCGALGITPGWLEYSYNDVDAGPTASAITDANPGLPSDRRVALLNAAAGTNAIVVPRPFAIAGLPAGALTPTAVVTAAQIAAIGKLAWTPAVAVGAEPLPAANAARFRWDAVNKRDAVLPQPFHADDTLAVLMDPNPLGAPVGADLDGALDADAATHVLHTTAAGREGELDPQLLRAPALGLARFERYRHIQAAVAGTAITGLSVVAQSASGAMILRVLPDAVTPNADNLEPILQEHDLVFEHLAVESVAKCLGAIVWMQILRFDELTGIAKFKDEVRRQCAWAIRCWLASGTLALGAAGTSAVAAAATDPFKADKAPPVATIKAAITAILANATAKAGLRGFIVQTYAHILAGKHWTELAIEFPAAPGGRVAAQAWAHAALENVMMASDTLVVTFAGCPLGRASTVYPFAPLVPDTSDLLRKGVSTFDLEALVLAGRAAAVFPAVAPPATPVLPTGSVDLTVYAGSASGSLAAVRLVEEKRTRAFTTRDCLRTSVTGWHHSVEITSRMDFAPFAAAGHPLADALLWNTFAEARTVRAAMDTLDATRHGAKSLGRGIVDFWVSASDFATNPQWPFQAPGVAAPLGNAGPADPYKIADTIRGSGGFDVFDIDSALRASDFLRNGADRTQSVPLPVILALLDREGYRMDSTWQRSGARGFVFRDNLNKFTTSQFTATNGIEGFGVADWELRVFGLDIVNRGLNTTELNWRRSARVRFASHLQTLLDAGVVVDLVPARMKEYVLARVAGKAGAPAFVVQTGLLSRELQWIGIVAQHGEFQRRHRLLCQGSAAGPLDRFFFPSAGGTLLPDIPEYVTGPPPAPGANAEAAQRFDYLAYYSLLYLAFNGGPAVVNTWVDAVNAHRGAMSVPKYFLYKITDAESAGGGRELWHRGHILRFITALDAYLRLTGPDTAAIVRPNPPWDK